MGKFIDMTGWIMSEHGVNGSMLKVIGLAERINNEITWKCECMNDGNIVYLSTDKVKKNKSCGCLRRINHIQKHGDAKRGKIERLYRIYRNMIQRCTNPNHADYQWYGGKGIHVCEEWMRDYNLFKTWAINSGYEDNLTIDRINSDNDYFPDNCRWETMITQNNNKKSIEKYEYNGELHSISEWARIIGVNRELLRDRIKRLGWDFKKAIETPPRKRIQH